MFRVRFFPFFKSFHFLSETFPVFQGSPSHYFGSVLLIFKARPSHFLGQSFPPFQVSPSHFSSQTFSLFLGQSFPLFKDSHFFNFLSHFLSQSFPLFFSGASVTPIFGQPSPFFPFSLSLFWVSGLPTFSSQTFPFF